MDLNLTTTIANNNQENNQLLLNAIKNKFAAKTIPEAASFSPPKFSIPILKIPKSESTTKILGKNITDENPDGSPSTQLNKFLLKQLQEQHKTNVLSKDKTGFVLPNLHFGNKFSTNEQKNVELREFKTANTNIQILTTALNKLQVDEHSKETNIPTKPQILATPAIDLTSALASKLENHQQVKSPTTDFKKPSKNLQNTEDLDFEIPFIDCDHIDASRKCTILIPTSNDYCVTDVSHLKLKHTLAEPSAIGRLLNSHDNKYTEPLPLMCFSEKFQQQSVKHNIEPFRFDTKSPDDLVIDALNKYQRRYHN